MSSSIELLTLHQLNIRHQNLLKEINKVKNEIEKRQKEELKDPIKEDTSDKDPILPELFENIGKNQVPELDKPKESSSTEFQKKVKVVIIKKKLEKSDKLS